MTSPFPLIINAGILATLLVCCKTAPAKNDAERDILEGTIDYPFAEDSKSIGRDPKEDKFVIKSTVGSSEYEVQIPGAARDYDIEVPLADMKRVGANSTTSDDTENVKPQVTDNEFVRDMPKIQDPDDRGLVDGAFGVGQADGPRQSPSYTLHLTKINKLYLQRQYELALIEINDLLTYYPTGVKLYKMKGTILIKLRNYKMAEMAWTRALELTPEDNSLKHGLESLRRRVQ